MIKPVTFYTGLILEWRRISNALSKVVFPLQKEKQLHPALDMFRIYGWCQTHTATGRVTMSEPNLQNIPKDFDVQMPGSSLRYSITWKNSFFLHELGEGTSFRIKSYPLYMIHPRKLSSLPNRNPVNYVVVKELRMLARAHQHNIGAWCNVTSNTILLQNWS